jgi:hypothetical protein
MARSKRCARKPKSKKNKKNVKHQPGSNRLDSDKVKLKDKKPFTNKDEDSTSKAPKVDVIESPTFNVGEKECGDSKASNLSMESSL